jgi:hypothetical protein
VEEQRQNRGYNYAAPQAGERTEEARQHRCQENQEGSKEHRIVDADYSSGTLSFLCFGFSRWFLGLIGREGGIVPTRSRASLRTPCFWSNAFFLGTRDNPEEVSGVYNCVYV